jgi:pimeloyl-ACP methyl ester carboxylesterase
MASATPRSGKNSRQQPGRHSKERVADPSDPNLIVEPIWLLKAGGLVILAALFCGYLTYCLLFYQGQWQLVLHPDHSKPAPATIAGTPYETVHFGVDESGTPQLAGWWIPAVPNGRYASETILYLPSGDGSLADAESRLTTLHSLGINVFAFDYRGYGQSAATHPSEQHMNQDADSAWKYLTVSRQISGSRIIPLGEGVGASIAANLAGAQKQIAGVILGSPRTDLFKIVLNDPRTRLLPIRILFHEDFDMAVAVKSLNTPKLFLLPEGADSLNIARSASEPRVIVALPPSQSDSPAYLEQIGRFLDQLHPNP